MKKNEFYEGIVEELKFPNKGMVRVAGEETRVLVKNTIPGQNIRFQLKKNRKHKPEGNLTELIQPSEREKQIPPCRHFSDCGGCAYQTMDYENQKKLKLEQVQQLLENVYPDFPLEECLSSPRMWEYRNKMEFSFGDECKGGSLTLGLHKRGSFYDIVPVTSCHIVDPDFRKILEASMDFFRERNTSFYHKITHEGVLRHLLVRKAWKTGEILVCLVTTSQEKIPEKDYCECLQSLSLKGKYAGILHMIYDGLADVVRAEKTNQLMGRDYFYEELLGLTFKISPFSFFQTNSSGAEVLYRVVREYIGDINEKVVFDLYSGTGTIAQILAPVAKKVVGVEIVEEAVEAARENAAGNHLDNCFFHAGDVLKVIDELQEKPDTIVLDPPREGIHPKALRKILDFQVDRIVYVSCKPTSLARDMETILEYGYRPIKAKCVDMFPWTRNVETVVQLVNIGAKPDYTVRLEIDVDEFYKTVGEEKRHFAKPDQNYKRDK